MTPRQASAALEELLFDEVDNTANPKRALDALIVAKQALDILATLEENLNLNEPITIEKTTGLRLIVHWEASRGYRTHLGADLTDTLGQMCTTLVLERGEPL